MEGVPTNNLPYRNCDISKNTASTKFLINSKITSLLPTILFVLDARTNQILGSVVNGIFILLFHQICAVLLCILQIVYLLC